MGPKAVVAMPLVEKAMKENAVDKERYRILKEVMEAIGPNSKN